MTLQRMLMGAASKASAALTPVDVGAALWLDCYDSSTITDVSGAASQINDKSGNNRHAAQSTAASRPAITTASGKQVLRFDGVNDFLSIASSFFPSGAPSGVSFIVACVVNADGNNFGSIITTFVDYSYEGCALALGNGRWRLFPPSNSSAQTGAIQAQGLQVVTMVATAGATGVIEFFKNGTQLAVGNIGQDIASSFTNTVVNAAKTQIGPFVVDDPSFCAKFDLHQLAVVTGSSSSTTRQQLEGWAAWAADLQGSLPAGHPYKNARP